MKKVFHNNYPFRRVITHEYLYPYITPILETSSQREREWIKMYLRSEELEKEKDFCSVELDLLYTFNDCKKKKWVGEEEKN